MSTVIGNGFCPARQVGSFVTYCPALGKRAGQTPHFKLSAPAAARKMLELLRTNPVVVLCGPHEQNFEANRQIGKTHLVYMQLIPVLEREGKRSAHLNLQALLDPEMILFYDCVNIENIRSRLDALPEADVYFFDDVQYVLPAEKQCYTSGYNDSVSLIWDKIGNLVKAGKKVVLISTLHPKDARCQGALYNEIIIQFLIAPRVELTCNSRVQYMDP